ncbi:Ig-like domain-containing protein [Trebonia kvetii]|nr:Ig-like domain-containing protein [Trebonia kvetii]
MAATFSMARKRRSSWTRPISPTGTSSRRGSRSPSHRSTRATPAGKVTVKAGRTAVCVITLKSGKGTCTLTARKLPAGTYTLTAAYPGSTDYAGSAAAKKTLTIVK